MVMKKMTQQEYEYFKWAEDKLGDNGLDLTRYLEELSLKFSDSTKAKHFVQRYNECKPFMIDGNYYKIFHLELIKPTGCHETPLGTTTPFTCKMLVYPVAVGGAVKKTLNYSDEGGKELILNISPRFLNHRGKKLAELYSQLAKVEKRIHEAEESSCQSVH